MFYKFLIASALIALGGCQSKPTSETTKTDSTTAQKPATASPEAKTTVSSSDTLAVTAPTSASMSPLDSLALIGPKITGSILPNKRIVAFYGNPHSNKMGILGEYGKDYPRMLRQLDDVAQMWNKADPTKPVQEALHLVAISAQETPQKDGNYRLRMSDYTIRKVIRWAAEHNAICFLDIQVGKAPLKPEIEYLEKYLKLPYVHLGIDPEFSMKTGARPGTKIGTYDAADINMAVQYLSKIKRENNLPTKILVVHRFTQHMVTNYQNIKLDPNVQIVMHMDGWGPPSLKTDSYRDYIVKEPVQYTGFKLFYKNDLKKVDPHSSYKTPHMMEPAELLALDPKPIYIQYQ